MLRLGVIEPTSSPYNSPVVVVKKKNEEARPCCDLRKVNKITEFDAEPLPDVEYLFSRLWKGKFFNKLDLTKGYWAIPMKVEDRPKTAFTTSKGQFQWVTMPFGFSRTHQEYSEG